MRQGRKGNNDHRGGTAARAVVIRSFVSVVTFVSFVSLAAPASAELVYFNTGRTMSVKAHRVEGDSLVLELRSGGEMIWESALVARFAPDEVAYPEPVVETPAAPVQDAQATAGP